MAMPGIYRRVLPSPPAVEFASSDGKQLFDEALQSGTMEGFFKLISNFQTQCEPAYCGLASLSMVLNALAIDPGREWRGPWRWFDESMLDCCEHLEKVKDQGITFDEVANLARCAGASVEAFRMNQTSIDDFRRHVVACTSSEGRHLIASYHRRRFKQMGSGHFSPIGGYHAGQDMALILDVARFKYPPHWVPLSLLWDAMKTVDKATGRHRGFLLISRIQKASSLLFTPSCKHESWINTAKFLIEGIPRLLVAEDIDSVQKVLSVIFNSLPTDVEDFVKWVAEVRIKEEGVTSLSEEEKARLDVKGELLQLVHETELYKHVSEWLASAGCCCEDASSPHEMQTLNEIAAKVCCQGAELLSGTVTAGKNKQRVEVLVPVIQKDPECTKGCVVRHPASNDVLTVLLLALPPRVWSGIKDKNLLNDFFPLVLTERLPLVLQDEVLHLRQQLPFLQVAYDSPSWMKEFSSAPLSTVSSGKDAASPVTRRPSRGATTCGSPAKDSPEVVPRLRRRQTSSTSGGSPLADVSRQSSSGHNRTNRDLDGQRRSRRHQRSSGLSNGGMDSPTNDSGGSGKPLTCRRKSKGSSAGCSSRRRSEALAANFSDPVMKNDDPGCKNSVPTVD